MKLRFTREVRDLVVMMWVAVAGALAAWALANIKTEMPAVLALVLVVAIVLAVAAVVLKAVQVPSEEPSKNARKRSRRVRHVDEALRERAPQTKSATDRSQAP